MFAPKISLLDRIANAFANIEVHDVRASEIEISKDRLKQLMLQPAIRRIIDCNAVHSTFDISTGFLWGAKIKIVDGLHKFRILGEEGFINNLGNRHSASVFGIPSKITILVKTREHLFRNATNEEERASDTLREMISEAEFRKYVKYGFILVKGSSGNVYQIFRNNRHVKVWQNGQMIEEICVRIKDNKIPATDNIIAFKVMIETDEEEFKKLGNVYKRAA